MEALEAHVATLAKSIWMTAAIDIKDPLFWGFIAAVAFNPLFWNWAARSEFKHKTISSSVLVRFTHKKLFSASKSPISINTWGCYLLALAIFLLGLVRDWFFKLAMDAQPKVRSLPQLAIRLFTLAAPTLAGKDHFQLDSLSSETLDQLDWWTLAYGINFILFGNILVLSSMYKLGITGTYLGDYFGILMPAKITSFPFNLMSNPMYTGATMVFFGTALFEKSPTGVFLSVWVWIVYQIALMWEGPFTASIYANATKATTTASGTAAPSSPASPTSPVTQEKEDEHVVEERGRKREPPATPSSSSKKSLLSKKRSPSAAASTTTPKKKTTPSSSPARKAASTSPSKRKSTTTTAVSSPAVIAITGSGTPLRKKKSVVELVAEMEAETGEFGLRRSPRKRPTKL